MGAATADTEESIVMAIKCVIFYFSQSGGTKKISEIIARELNSAGYQCDLVRLTTLQKDLALIRSFHFDEYRIIGFGTPVYYFQPPQHLCQVLEAMPDLSGRRGFLFTTSGGSPGSTLYQMQRILSPKNLDIIAGNDRIVCCDRHPFYRDFGYVFPPSIGHPDPADLEKASQFGADVAGLIADTTARLRAPFWKRDSTFARCCSHKNLNTYFPEIRLNDARCNRCGLCVSICPLENIVLDPFPKWLHACNRCYCCELGCPTRAIECDWDGWADVMNVLLKKKGFVPRTIPPRSVSRRFNIFRKKLWLSWMFVRVKLGMK